MLRKRTRSVQKDQYKSHLMSESASESCFPPEGLGQKQKNGSFFSVPGLFVGFSIKGVTDSDPAWSPTSPLDYRVFTNLANPFRSPRSGLNETQKIWNTGKVGLGIVNSLDDDNKSSGKILQSLGSKNVLFGSQLGINVLSSKSCLRRSIDSSFGPKSLPNNYAISRHTKINSPNLQLGNSDMSLKSGEMQVETKPHGKIRSCLSDCGRPLSPLTGLTYYSHNSSSEDFLSEKKSNAGYPLIGGASSIDKKSNAGSPLIRETSTIENSFGTNPISLPISIGSSHGLVGSLSATEIEQSEDYTCVISHGPNPRTTHIFGDCILKCHSNELAGSCCKKREVGIGSFEVAKCSNTSLPYPSDDFLSFCYFCKKKLEEGKDIYMYRGEKAFCSCSCRDQEILIEEEMEKPFNNSSCDSPKSTCSDDIFITGMVDTT